MWHLELFEWINSSFDYSGVRKKLNKNHEQAMAVGISLLSRRENNKQITNNINY